MPRLVWPRFCAPLALLAFVALCAPTAHAQRYIVLDLGSLSDNDSFGSDVNTYTQVVGTSWIVDPPSYSRRGFLWWFGPMQNLGTIPGGDISRAAAINDYGWIAGSVRDADEKWHPALQIVGGSGWGQLDHPGVHGFAYGMSEAIDVVGYWADESWNSYAYYWHPWFGATDLGAVAGEGTSLAFAVNTALQIGGWSFLPPQPECLGQFVGSTPTLWEKLYDGQWSAMALPTDDHCFGSVYGLNEAGVLVGQTRPTAFGFDTTPARWWRGHGWWFFEHLDAPEGTSGEARDINVSNQIVGHLDNRAHLWECGAAIDLNDEISAESGWVLERAQAINDRGEIVGWGKNPQGETHAFLLMSHHVVPPC